MYCSRKILLSSVYFLCAVWLLSAPSLAEIESKNSKTAGGDEGKCEILEDGKNSCDEKIGDKTQTPGKSKSKQKSNANDDGKEKYKTDPKWQKYVVQIEKALKEYKECPVNDCSCYNDVLEGDLKPFRDGGGITLDMMQSVKDRGTKYQIIGHRLFRGEKCMFPARCKGVEHFILEILDQLPDMEFMLNDRDNPQVNRHWGLKPVLSFSKTRDYNDIMYPAWSFWEGGPAISLHPTGIGRWDLMRDKVSSHKNLGMGSNRPRFLAGRGRVTSP